MLLARYQYDLIEAGCDEAGRGCLAGPVFAAAVVLPHDFDHPLLKNHNIKVWLHLRSVPVLSFERPEAKEKKWAAFRI